MSEESDDEFLDRMKRLIEPLGCNVYGLAPDVITFKGDKQIRKRGVVVGFPRKATEDEIAELSMEIDRIIEQGTWTSRLILLWKKLSIFLKSLIEHLPINTGNMSPAE